MRSTNRISHTNTIYSSINKQIFDRLRGNGYKWGNYEPWKVWIKTKRVSIKFIERTLLRWLSLSDCLLFQTRRSSRSGRGTETPTSTPTTPRGRSSTASCRHTNTSRSTLWQVGCPRTRWVTGSLQFVVVSISILSGWRLLITLLS